MILSRQPYLTLKVRGVGFVAACWSCVGALCPEQWLTLSLKLIHFPYATLVKEGDRGEDEGGKRDTGL